MAKKTASKVGLEGFLWGSIELITESAYQIAVRLGFKRSFVHFLTELQETMAAALKKEHASTRARRTPVKLKRVAATAARRAPTRSKAVR